MVAERLRTLIVDDEPLAVERMQILCAGIAGVEVVGTASDGAQALRLIEAIKPDLLLLDIGMPEMDGVQTTSVLAALPCPPMVVFVTAFDSFAVQAFNLDAVDYVLKPVSADRLARAVDRALARGQQPRPAISSWAEEFWVPYRTELVRVAADDIDRIDAERDYMRLHVGPRSFLLHETIAALEARLDPQRFIRLHRSTIVRRDRIVALRHEGLGIWCADLTNGDSVRIGRTFLAHAKAMAGR